MAAVVDPPSSSPQQGANRPPDLEEPEIITGPVNAAHWLRGARGGSTQAAPPPPPGGSSAAPVAPGPPVSQGGQFSGTDRTVGYGDDGWRPPRRDDEGDAHVPANGQGRGLGRQGHHETDEVEGGPACLNAPRALQVAQILADKLPFVAWIDLFDARNRAALRRSWARRRTCASQNEDAGAVERAERVLRAVYDLEPGQLVVATVHAEGREQAVLIALDDREILAVVDDAEVHTHGLRRI